MKTPSLHCLLAAALLISEASLPGQNEFPPGKPGGPQRNDRPPRGPGRPGDQGAFPQGPRGPGPGFGPEAGPQRAPFRKPERMGNEPGPANRPPMVEPRVIVMNLGRLDTAAANRMDADLNVMLTILEHELADLNGTRPLSAMGIPVSLQNRVGRHGAIFLEEYGVLFRLFVAFPLSRDAGALPPGQGAGNGTVWEQTRRDLYRQNDPGNSATEMYYGEDRINALRQALVQALKQAANIHSLKAQDHISVTVTSALGRRLEPEHNAEGEGKADALSRLERGLPVETVGIDTLIVSAAYADIQDAAAAKITDEEFTRRVRMRGSWETPPAEK